MHAVGNACSFRSNANTNHMDLTLSNSLTGQTHHCCWSNIHMGQYCSTLAYLFYPDHAPLEPHLSSPHPKSALLMLLPWEPHPLTTELRFLHRATQTEESLSSWCPHCRLLWRASYLNLSYRGYKHPKDMQCTQLMYLSVCQRKRPDGGNEMSTNKR